MLHGQTPSSCVPTCPNVVLQCSISDFISFSPISCPSPSSKFPLSLSGIHWALSPSRSWPPSKWGLLPLLNLHIKLTNLLWFDSEVNRAPVHFSSISQACSLPGSSSSEVARMSHLETVKSSTCQMLAISLAPNKSVEKDIAHKKNVWVYSKIWM